MSKSEGYEKSDSPGSHEIKSCNVLICAETGRVVAVFYNDYDIDDVVSKLAIANLTNDEGE